MASEKSSGAGKLPLRIKNYNLLFINYKLIEQDIVYNLITAMTIFRIKKEFQMS